MIHLFLHFNDGLQFPKLQLLKRSLGTGTVEVTHITIAESELKSGIVEKSIVFSSD